MIKRCFSFIIRILPNTLIEGETHKIFNIKNLIFQDKENDIIDIKESKSNNQNKIIITFKSTNPKLLEYYKKYGCSNS